MPTFLENYDIYCQGTEAHPTYHKFSAISALAAVVGRRVWIDMGRFHHYPNLYIVLVGGSGNRKTAAMTIARAFVKGLKTLPFSAEATTKEKLVLDMEAQETKIPNLIKDYPERSVQSCMSCFVTELTEFLGPSPAHMIDFLTTIYDLDTYDTRVKNSKSVCIEGPCLNMLGCTTPERITSYLKQDVLSSGFGRRTLFILETDKGDKVPFPVITQEQTDAYNRCASYAKEIMAQAGGPFIWEPKAKQFMIDWYTGLEIPDGPLGPYYDSKQAQLCKIAMLMSLSESTKVVMEVRHLEQGLALLDIAERKMSRVFQGVGRNELNIIAQQAEDIVYSKAGGELFLNKNGKKYAHIIEEKRLQVLLFKDGVTREIEEVVEHLIRANKFQKIIAKKTPTAIAIPWIVTQQK